MKFSTAFTLSLLIGTSSAFTPSTSFGRSLVAAPSVSSTQQYMFGGAGALEEDDEFSEEEEANIQAAARQLGFSPSEYKLVLRMQKNLADAVNTLRVTGGEGDVTVTMDGNSPPKFLEVKITDEGKALGKAALEKTLLTAMKDANEQAKKGQQAAVTNMNADIAEEMKKMGA